MVVYRYDTSRIVELLRSMTPELKAILAKMQGERDVRQATLESRTGASTLKKGGKADRRRKRREKQAQDAELERLHGRSLVQARYYRKNKAKLNAQRALKARTPKSVYDRAKRKAKTNGIAWEFTFDTWWNMWEEAGTVVDPRDGFTKPAFEAKGGNYLIDTQMLRKDKEGPWSPDNCYIAIPRG